MASQAPVPCLDDFDFDRPFRRHHFHRSGRRSTIMGSPHFRWAFEKCRQNHPGISIDQDVLGGIPHVEGTRLAVSQLLGRIYVLGSVDAVAEYYYPDVTRDQVNEAVSFAQSFVEFASDPS